MFLGIYGIDEYVPIPPVTHRFSSGAAYAPTTITYSIYEEGNTTGLDEDVDMTPASPFDSVTGFYYARRQLTAAAGFESNKTYVVLVKATVDSVAAIESHVFQIRPLQTGDSYAIVNGDHGLVSIQDDIDSLLADVGDASASTLGSLYAILGNAAATIDSRTASGAPGANNGVPTTNGDKINQTVDLTAGQSIACSDKTGFSLSATGADLILKTATFVQAIVDAVLDEALGTGAHDGVGTVGKRLLDAYSYALAGDTHATDASLDALAAHNALDDVTYGLVALNTLLTTTGILLNATQSLYAPAKAGDQMDLVNAPNAMAVTAIQNGLSTFDSTSDGVTLTTGGIDAIFDRNSSLSISFETLINRIYQMINDKMEVTNESGDVVLRNIADSADIATGNVTDNSTTTVRTGLTWV